MGNKNNKAYALISASVNEEVSHHITPFIDAFVPLKKMKELYGSHSELEVVQLMIKLFNLELKEDDPLALATKIRAIMHDIEAITLKWMFLSHILSMHCIPLVPRLMGK